MSGGERTIRALVNFALGAAGLATPVADALGGSDVAHVFVAMLRAEQKRVEALDAAVVALERRVRVAETRVDALLREVASRHLERAREVLEGGDR